MYNHVVVFVISSKMETLWAWLTYNSINIQSNKGRWDQNS